MQLSIGDQLAEMGAQAALDNADRNHENWSERALEFLREYSKKRTPFMIEDVREASAGVLEQPPSKRAWGGVVRRARKEGWLISIGFQKVKNPKAHSTPASLWVRV